MQASGYEARGLEKGKDIDWTKAAPSITRPVWELPALEILDWLENMLDDDWNGSKDYSGPEFTQLIELHGELAALFTYGDWAIKTKEEAESIGNEAKFKFYEGLLQEVFGDKKDTYDDLKGWMGRWGLDKLSLSGKSSMMKALEDMGEMFNLRFGLRDIVRSGQRNCDR